MKKDDILNASRKEHKNKDLAEIEVIYQAGSHAGRVGEIASFLHFSRQYVNREKKKYINF